MATLDSRGWLRNMQIRRHGRYDEVAMERERRDLPVYPVKEVGLPVWLWHTGRTSEAVEKFRQDKDRRRYRSRR